MHRRTLYLGKQNRPCHQHFINTEVSGPREAPWRTLGIEPSPQLFCSYSAPSASARQTSSLGCHFLSSPRLGPGQIVRLVARWGRHLWLYLCHSFRFLEGIDIILLGVTWLGGWGPKGLVQRETHEFVLMSRCSWQRRKEVWLSQVSCSLYQGYPLRGWRGRWQVELQDQLRVDCRALRFICVRPSLAVEHLHTHSQFIIKFHWLQYLPFFLASQCLKCFSPLKKSYLRKLASG